VNFYMERPISKLECRRLRAWFTHHNYAEVARLENLSYSGARKSVLVSIAKIVENSDASSPHARSFPEVWAWDNREELSEYLIQIARSWINKEIAESKSKKAIKERKIARENMGQGRSA